MAGGTVTKVAGDFSDLMWGHLDERIGGTCGFVVIGETLAALITGQQISGQQIHGKADQTMMADRTGVDMSNNLSIYCYLLSVPLPVHL
jgi:hypothetical protein